MSTQNEQERERLKEEYKEHYRRIKEAKARLKTAEQKGKIAQAINNMDPNNLLETMDEFLGKVRDKVTHVEARLDVAMDSLGDDDSKFQQEIKKDELDEVLKKQKAKETLQQVKAEMGMLYSEIEKHAEEIKTEKTIGQRQQKSPSSANDKENG